MIFFFDFGSKYIGLTIYNNKIVTIYNLKCFIYNKNLLNWNKIDILIKFYKPRIIMIGMPMHNKVYIKNINILITDFIFLFVSRYNSYLFIINEYLSTFSVKKVIKNIFLSKNRKYMLINAFSSKELIKYINF